MKRKKIEVPMEMDAALLKAQMMNLEIMIKRDLSESEVPNVIKLEILKQIVKNLEEEVYDIDLGGYLDDLEVPDTKIEIDFEKGEL